MRPDVPVEEWTAGVRDRLADLARSWRPPPAPTRGRPEAPPRETNRGEEVRDDEVRDDEVRDEEFWGEAFRDAGDEGGPAAASSRWVPDRRGLRAVGVVVATLLLIAAWWWWTGRPRAVTPVEALPAVVSDQAVAAPSSAALAGTSADAIAATVSTVPDGATAGAATGGQPVPEVVVHVLGTVVHPGVYRLPAGSRVVDAVDAAGGLRPGARSGTVNLARVLVDGEQVRLGPGAATPAPSAGPGVPGQGAAGAASAGPGAPGAVPGGQVVLDLNAATAEQLEELPRIGPVLAQRIIDWRLAHGPFRDVVELQEVPGIGAATFAGLAPLVRV
ncbi:MAG: ComEA family DNA-binding protein [Candidatus Nanopelagicales bacterium]